MRFSCIETIYNAALKDPKIVFITGDLGHMNTEEFKKNLPGRYFNAGMAEQNIVGMASGMALSGMKVFVYSIVPFITLRCIEQIKIDMCIHNVDVTVIGVGGGLAYGSAGATHYSIEEVGMLRTLPNMKVVCPATPSETKVLTQQIIDQGGPAYIRIGRGKEADRPLNYPLTLGKASVIRPGTDIAIMVSGTIADEALKVADMLKAKNIDVEVINMHTIKPLDTEIVLDRAKSRKGVFTLEEHSVIGGLGAAVAEVLSTVTPRNSQFGIFGIQDTWPKQVGNQAYLRKLLGIDADAVANGILKKLS
jgi:transketolase